MKNEKLIELSNRLLELPKEISKLSLDLLDKTEYSNEISNEISKLEMAIKLSISNKTDDAGKKVYTNAESREAAFVELKENDTELQLLHDKHNFAQGDIQKLKIEIEKCSNEQRNIRSLLQFFATATELEN